MLDRDDVEKKAIAMVCNGEAALSVILRRAIGGLRSYGVPYFGQDASITLLADPYYIRIWAESKQHFVYFQIGYRHYRSVLNVRVFPTVTAITSIGVCR